MLRTLPTTVLACLAASASAQIDRQLQRRLAAASPDAKFTAIVRMAEQLDLERTLARLEAMNATRAFRHRLVVESLRAVARRGQAGLLDQLAVLRERRDVDWHAAFWIFNGVAVRANRAALAAIAARPEVGVLAWAGGDAPARSDLPAPIDARPSSAAPAGAEAGLLACRADYVWGRGFTGHSTLVSSIDTGVDASHPALFRRWRGLTPHVSLASTWFDPTNKTRLPADKLGHGTHTMGVICGDDGFGNRIGMAPNAQWIASNPIDQNGSRAQRNVWYLQAFQWVADPDGDAKTVDDVPDVCNCSWGLNPAQVGGCATIFDLAIDGVEASTVAIAFAAGNDGLAGPLVPAGRIATDVNTFAVGALEPDAKTVARFSSRGPSACDRRTVKPEVVAPGVLVRSAHLGGKFYEMSGTSMASPHVSGGLALLRDVWADVPVDTAKRTLMRTAVDVGKPGEDNHSGHGRIDLERAYNALLAARPLVSVSAMGTRVVVREGGAVETHVAVQSFSKKPQLAFVRIWLESAAFGSVDLLAPTALVFPPEYDNRRRPELVHIAVPRGLPDRLIGVPLTICAEARDAYRKRISSGCYRFRLAR